jgi:uncharacterized membrane protein
MTNLKTRGWVLNALVAAIYIVLSIGPASLNLASGAIQFRLSESLNHLVVFDRKYIVGVVTGVVIFNAIFSPLGWLDVVFGGRSKFARLAVGRVGGAEIASALGPVCLKYRCHDDHDGLDCR